MSESENYSADMLSNSSLSDTDDTDDPLYTNLSVIIDCNFEACFFTKPSSIIFTCFSITNIVLLLPLSILILYLGFQKWRRQRSTSTTARMSHSDSFTYHMMTMELIGVSGFVLAFLGVSANHMLTFRVGYFMTAFIWHGELFFHILTCTERYLAVIHPITYRSLKGERGIKIRNICIGCVWLLSTGGSGLMSSENISLIVGISLLILSLIFITFCSLSVLFVLIRPGPGEHGGDRGRVDQSKQKAFYTIALVLGVLLLRIGWNIGWFGVWTSGIMSCLAAMFGIWFNLPCSLALPLLYLYRAEVLCGQNHPV